MNIFKIATFGLFLIFSGALGAACPDLTGDYVCTLFPDTPYAHKVKESYSQIEKGGITTYTIKMESDADGMGTIIAIADGEFRYLGEHESSFQTQFYCENGALIMRHFSDAQDMLVTAELMEDGSLRKKSTLSEANGAGDMEHRRDEETICPQG